MTTIMMMIKLCNQTTKLYQRTGVYRQRRRRLNEEASLERNLQTTT